MASVVFVSLLPTRMIVFFGVCSYLGAGINIASIWQ